VTASNPTKMVYHEEVLKCMAFPCSFAIQVKTFEGFQGFGRYEDVTVFPFHLDKSITKFDHALSIRYFKLFISLSYFEKLT
jgi:hypothetical protein